MSKARLTGKNVKLFIFSQSNYLPVLIGELDKFSKKSRTKLIHSRPIGFINEGATHQYGGWDLSFDASKVDWALAEFHWLQDQKLRNGEYIPEFIVTETVTHYSKGFGILGKPLENWVYRGVSFYGLEGEWSTEDFATESFQGFSPIRTRGPVDTTVIFDPVNAVLRQKVFETDPVKLEMSGQEIDLPNLERLF